MTEYAKLTEEAKNLEKKGFCRRAVTQWRKAAFIADSEKKQEACIAAIKRCSGYYGRSF